MANYHADEMNPKKVHKRAETIFHNMDKEFKKHKDSSMGESPNLFVGSGISGISVASMLSVLMPPLRGVKYDASWGAVRKLTDTTNHGVSVETPGWFDICNNTNVWFVDDFVISGATLKFTIERFLNRFCACYPTGIILMYGKRKKNIRSLPTVINTKWDFGKPIILFGNDRRR